MSSRAQIRGVLLEEVILSFLRATGYRTVGTPGGDPTLSSGPAGLIVKGRGTGHQIDAVADFRVAQPFSNPPRLLVEGKFYLSKPVGLPIVRGTVGVLKDVSEFWFRPDPSKPAAKRYHYQAAIFAASPFTKDAQDYAFAQDIYLLPLRESAFFIPVLHAIEQGVATLRTDPTGDVIGVDLSDLRRFVRRALQPNIEVVAEPFRAPLYEWVLPVIGAANRVGGALIGVVGRAFPILLTPRIDLDIAQLPNELFVEIHFERANMRQGWELRLVGTRQALFSFDLPGELFNLYATEGALSAERAVELKAEYLNEIQAIHAPADTMRIVTFRLSSDWLRRVRDNLTLRDR